MAVSATGPGATEAKAKSRLKRAGTRCRSIDKWSGALACRACERVVQQLSQVRSSTAVIALGGAAVARGDVSSVENRAEQFCLANSQAALVVRHHATDAPLSLGPRVSALASLAKASLYLLSLQHDHKRTRSFIRVLKQANNHHQ